jgi:hypothetical protein
MAALIVTPAALDHIAGVIRRERMEKPLISVQWDIGQADVKRAPDGGIHWDRAPSQWRISIIDLVSFEREVKEVLPGDDVVLPAANATISGFDFFVYGRPGNRMLNGCKLELGGEELHVHEEAI